ncbi:MULTISPECIES: hypothetical protein [unclassified Methylobacterium]|uniref:hypothetical protein n=1 Tax=unclassified Methylobacterium TaxID=2615210 RepID=UPI002269B1F2|nr:MULTISPECIES: hypothetical protein [unclassified Methylobacterium]
MQDQDGAIPMLHLWRRTFPFITKAAADAADASDQPAIATIVFVEVVRRPLDQVGFAVHWGRWFVEQFFDWIGRHRRL